MVVKPPFPQLSFFLAVSPCSSSSSRLPSLWFHLLFSILCPVLACQPFILYQDESVRVGPNIKGDGSPLVRDRDTKIRRSDGSWLPYWRTERKASGRFLCEQNVIESPSIAIFFYGSWNIELDYWEYIVLKCDGWGVQLGLWIKFPCLTSQRLGALFYFVRRTINLIQKV